MANRLSDGRIGHVSAVRFRAVVPLVAALAATLWLSAAGEASARAIWSPQPHNDRRAHLTLQLRHKEIDYLYAFGRQSVLTSDQGGAIPDVLYTSVHILELVPTKRCPGRPRLRGNEIVDDLRWQSLDQRSFSVSWMFVHGEKTRICGYLVRDLDPNIYDDEKRYVVIASAQALLPETAAAKEEREKNSPAVVVPAVLLLVIMVGYPVLRLMRRRRAAARTSAPEPRTPAEPRGISSAPRRETPPPPRAPPPPGTWTPPPSPGTWAPPRAPPPPRTPSGPPGTDGADELCPRTGKVKFATQHDAQRSVSRSHRRHALGHEKRPPLQRSYRCEFCNSWHVTKQGKRWG